LINATGDEFFLPDSAQFYFHDLPGVNTSGMCRTRRTPSALRRLDHRQSLLPGRADGAPCLRSRDLGISNHAPRGDWHVPTEVRLWQATNPSPRLPPATLGANGKAASCRATVAAFTSPRAVPPSAGRVLRQLTYAEGTGAAEIHHPVYVVPDVLPVPLSADNLEHDSNT